MVKSAPAIKDNHYLKKELYELVKTESSIFDFIQESCLDGIWYWDLNNPEEEWMSPRFWTALGYDYKVMPHKPSAWQGIINPDDFKLAIELVNKHCENPEIPYDQTLRYTHSNGSIVWIRCRALAIRDEEGKPIRMLGSHQDVTAYIKSEQTLIKNIDLLNYTQKIAGIGSWELDVKTNEVFWTEELYNMYGFDSKLPPPPYTEHMKLFAPESWEQLSSALNLTKDKGSPYELELKTIRKDGSQGYMWVRGEAQLDSTGSVTHIKGLAKDITEEKIAKEKIKVSEERWQFALEGSGDGVWEWRPQESKTFYSNRWIEMLGYKPEEFTDNDYEWRSRIHPDDIAFTFSEIAQNLKGNTDSFNFEYRFRNKEGNYLWILNRGKVVERNANGESIRVIGTHSDITKLKKTEELIKINETRLSLAIKAGGVGIWDWDIVSNTLTWDEQMFALYGIKKDEFSSAYDSWMNGVYEADKQRGDEEIQLAIKGEKDFNTEFRVQWSDGTIRHIRALATVLRDDEGNALRMIGTNWDITAEKEALAQVAAREEAEKANRAKSQFLANMSHEIRTPLNSIIGFTDLLKKTQLSKLQEQYANLANVSGHTLLGLVNDILDFSKIEAGMMDLDILKSDMVQLFEDSIDIVKLSAVEKNIELLLDIDPSMPRFAFVDPIRVKQILANLLGNAVKFTEQGEVELKVRFQQVDKVQGKLSISVRDTGIGISEDQQSKLFKPFSQADSSVTRMFGGTGLGLVISQLIANKMGGNIQVKSTLGVETVFYFDMVTHFEAGSKPDINKINGLKRCLIIDDNANNQLIMKHMLNQWQIDSECCDSGLDALKLIERAEPFDLIICDYDMPSMNGIETIRMLKNKYNSSVEKQPVILVQSSFDNSPIEKECEELGIRFRLSKPIKSADLFNILNNIKPKNDTGTDKGTSEVSIKDNTLGELKIMVVEDVYLNMVLIKAMLSDLGFTNEIIEAANGIEAVEKFRDTLPDLILMDVHMPKLDGIAATKMIREIESSIGKKVPIIALTAGALQEEKERCFESGMNDFITKPLSPDKLMTIINKNVIMRKNANETFPISDLEIEIHMDYQELVNSFKNRSVIQNVLEISLRDMPDQIIELEEAYKEKDPEKIHSAAHRLKGSASYMRFTLLTEMAAKIERESTDTRSDDLEFHLSELKTEWEVVKKIIRQKMD